MHASRIRLHRTSTASRYFTRWNRVLLTWSRCPGEQIRTYHEQHVKRPHNQTEILPPAASVDRPATPPILSMCSPRPHGVWPAAVMESKMALTKSEVLA